MEVTLKYQLLNKSTISSISYNPHHSILATISDGNDTATFYTHTHPLTFTPCFNTQSKPPSLGTITWSPNSFYLAVASIKVDLWKFDNFHLSPLRIINQGFIQIKNLSWSQDSQYYLCYGINPKDLPLSINIRHIQSNQLKQIFTQVTPIFANFDPFGKYIAVLVITNTLQFYDTKTLDRIRSINLSQTKNDIPSLRDKRNADWSPQYSYLVAPNLNDSRVPSAIIFDRNHNFTIKDILIGHQTTISSLKFNPCIFNYQSDITFILAIGDNSGCLSLWRIGKSNTYKQPLLIISSPSKAEQSIQGLQWNSQGDILFINTLKRYIIVVKFQLSNFGKKLTSQQKDALIISTYGVSNASQITGKKLQIFGQQSYPPKTSPQPPPLFPKPPTQKPPNHPPTKQHYIITKQQTIYNTTPNNRQKKRIIPSRLIPTTQFQNNQQININHHINNTINMNVTSHMQHFQEKNKIMNVKLTPMKTENKKEYHLPKGQILNLQHAKNITILSKPSKDSSNRQPYSKRIFVGQIKNITITRNHILVINSEKLFIYNHDLSIEQLPCYLGEITNFCANNSGTVFYMLTNGLIRGFNYLKHQYILQTSIVYLLLQQSQILTNPFSIFTVFDDDNDRLHIQLKSTYLRYFFSKQSHTWIQFDFSEGLYLPGHSLRVTKIQKTLAQNFYSSLITPALHTSHQPPNPQSLLNQYQFQLIYYLKYQKDETKYKQTLLKTLLNLKFQSNQQQLRKFIIQYFINKQSKYYIYDPQLWKQVKNIGGKTIQEFAIMENL